MKTKRIEFHTLRYPAHFEKTPRLSPAKIGELYAEVDRRRNSQSYEDFLRWCAENNTLLGSPLFRTFYSARRKREKAKHILFYNLRSISDHCTVALGLLGGCLSFLNNSHKDCEDTIELTRTFLVEIAIFDSTFSAAYARDLANTEFLDWVERNPRHKSARAERDKAFTLNGAWAKKEAADEYVNQAKLSVEREDLPSEHLNLIHEEKERLTQPNHDSEYDFDRSRTIQEHIAKDMQLNTYPPVSFEGIKNTLKKWNDAGRHLGWQPRVIRRRQEFEGLKKVLAQAVAANRVENEDFADTLWTDGEQYRRMRKW